MKRDKDVARGSSTVARFVGWFIVAGIVAVLIAGVTVVLLGREAGEREAIVDLRAKTLGLAQFRVQPSVTDALVNGNITAVSEVGAAVRHYVLDPSIARVNIWNKAGTIVYSDQARLIGTNRPPSPADIAALSSGAVRSGITDSSDPEHQFDRPVGKLLDVNVRILAPNREPLLLEVYYRYDAVETAGNKVWNRFAPFALGALGALAVVQIVIGSLLARRLRRRTAKIVAAVPEPEPEVVAPGASVREPDPGTELINALARLLARSNGGGIPNTLDTHNVHDTIPPAIAELLFRATEEALRNHDNASPVTVRLSDRDHVASLDVIDSGRNGQVDRRALMDLVADAGGRLLVDSADNGGWRVHVEVPLQ